MLGLGIGVSRLAIAVSTVGTIKQWFNSAIFNALDSVEPSVVMDFNNDRYALPKLGNELIVNGTFDVDGASQPSPWTVSATTSQAPVVNGRIRPTANGSGSGRVIQSFSTTPGKTYQLSVSRWKGTSTASAVYIGISASTITNAIYSLTNTTDETSVAYFIATQTTHFIMLDSSVSTNGVYAEYDNVSIREVLLGETGNELITNGEFTSATPLGSNLVTNGDFAGGTTTGWSVSAGTQQVVSGELEITGNGTGFAQSNFSVTLVPGKMYILTATARKGTANGNAVVRMGFNSLVAAVNTSGTTNVTGTQIFIAVRESESVSCIIANASATGTMYVDNISVREYLIGDVGPELITNGTFASDTSWLKSTSGSATVSISGGVATLTGNAGTDGAIIDQSIATVIGQTYQLIYNATAAVGFKVGTSQGNGNNIDQPNFSSFGWIVISFVATATTTWIRFQRFLSGGAAVDNVSIRLWTPITQNTGFEIDKRGNSVAYISGGQLTAIADGLSSIIVDQSITTEIGSVYNVIFYNGTNPITLNVGTTKGASDVSTATTPSSGWNIYAFVASSTTTWIRLTRSSSGTVTIDDFSVRKWIHAPKLRRATFAECFTYTSTNTTARTYFNSSGAMVADLTNNQPRFSWVNGKRQFVLENQSTNSIRNSTMVGAVAGTPGTMPTNWLTSLGTGMSREIVGTGTINGMSYIDIRFYGTPSSSPTSITFDTTYFTALNGETHTFSCYISLIAGSVSGFTGIFLRQITRNAGGTPLTTYGLPDIRSNLNSTLTRYVFTQTLSDATTATVEPVLAFSGTGSAVDITVRVAAPQHERSISTATTFIPTTTSTITRNIETARFSTFIEAILSRPALTHVYRGQSMQSSVGEQTIFGASSSDMAPLRISGATANRIVAITAAGNITQDRPVITNFTTSFGVARSTFTARSALSVDNQNANTAASGLSSVRTPAYLGRRDTSTAQFFNSYTDTVILYTTAVSDAAVKALAVAAT